MKISAIMLVLFVVQNLSCSGPVVRPRPPGADLSFLSGRLRLLRDKEKKLRSFLATGYFHYKDNKRDLNFSVRILREGGIFRITFRGNLDDALWADLLVKDGRVHLHFPLQKTLYRADLDGFDLYPFTRIHVKMEELLRLASLSPYQIPGGKDVQAIRTASGYLVFRESGKEQQKIYLNTRSLHITRSLVYRNKTIRGDIRYSLYKKTAGIQVPFKCTLKVPGSPVRAVLWITRIRPGSHYSEKEGKIEPDSGVSVREM